MPIETLDLQLLSMFASLQEREPDRFANLPAHGILYPRVTSAAPSRMSMISTKEVLYTLYTS